MRRSVAEVSPIPISLATRSLAATFVSLALAYGIWYSYSVFLVALLREFGWSRSVLAGAFSIFTLVHGAAGLPLGWLADRVGPRRIIMVGGALLGLALCLDAAATRPWHLYVTFGLLTSAGVALAGWVPAVILVQRWFPHRVGTAIGITSSGIGTGIFLVVPTCQWLIDTVGWRWTWRIAGLVLCAWIVPAALFLIKDPPRASVRATAVPLDEGLSLHDALGLPVFWLLGLAQAATSFANQMLLVHQVVYLVDHGITTLIAASVVGVVGLSSMVGKAGGGWLSDQIDRRITFTISAAAVGASIGVLGLLALSPSAAWAYLYAVLIGVGYSAPAAIFPALVSDRFRGRHYGAIFGALSVANALGGGLGPWVGGRVFDTYGTYAPAFIAAVIGATVSTAAIWSVGRGRPAAPTPGARS
jgi:MFS family permease